MKNKAQTKEEMATDALAFSMLAVEKMNIDLSAKLIELDVGGVFQIMVYEALLYYFVCNYSRLTKELGFPNHEVEKRLDRMFAQGILDGRNLPEHMIHRDKYNKTEN